jgi:tetratricopeptide (TPR) repeat protein
MMKRKPLSVVGVAAVLGFLLCPPASAGPLHEAAMAEVQRGIALCPTGNLDAAMEIFKGVEQQFPDETEAIGWARYWHSNCLLAGWRLSEIPPLMEPVWEQVVAGEITSPTAAFLFGHQYARVLDTGNYLRSVCERTTEFYEQLENPGVQIEEKAGFLQVFLSRCYHNTREFVNAAAAGEAAWEKGEALRGTVDAETAAALDVKPTVLAAWGRLEQAKAELHQGNVLLAQVMLAECAEEYCLDMQRHYVSEVETAQEEARLQLGLSSEVRADLLEKLVSTDEAIDKGLWLRATWHFANEAYNRGATEEAIAPMAVARTCYIAFPGWGLHIDLLWQRKIRGHTPNDLFIAELEREKDQGSHLERASMRIQLAEILAELNRGAEGLALLDEVPSVSTDPRLSMSLRVARAHCEFPGDLEAELTAYEEVLAADPGNRSLAEYVVEQVSPYRHGKMREYEFGPWLDEAMAVLPDSVYRLTKVRWQRDFKQDYDGALELMEPLLLSGDPETVLRAKEQKAILLYGAHRDEEAQALVQDLEQSIVDVRRREDALYQVAAWITYSRPERAIQVADKVLATRESRHWVDHALLVKLCGLSWMGRPDEAQGPFEELISLPPSETVGDGIVRMGEIYWKQLSDYESARANFEWVASASDEFPQAQATAYKFYAEMEESLGNHERAVEICDEGELNLPSSNVSGRESLRRIRDRAVAILQEGGGQ